jgi:dihydropteroate synthase
MKHNPRVLIIDGIPEAVAALKKVKTDGRGVGIMGPKTVFRVVKVHDISWRAANVLKQEMLARGAEAAVGRGVLEAEPTSTDMLLMGSLKQYASLIDKLHDQPFGLKGLAEELKTVLAAYDATPADMAWNGFSLPLSKRTCVMGILNVTPDSFSDGGRFAKPAEAIAAAERMRDEGADIIDVGGESTRPGAAPVTEEQEQARVIPVVEALAKRLDIPVSIDTYKAGTAKAALNAGAAMINDISGLGFDQAMAGVAAEAGVPVILSHIKGEPGNMQADPSYECVMGEISGYLREKTDLGLAAGVAPERIIIDPGIGFGKTVAHNLEILRYLRELTSLGYPVLVGASRKSFIGKILDAEADDRMEGTAAAVTASIINGASIVRVHDTKEMVRVVKIADAICGKTNPV